MTTVDVLPECVRSFIRYHHRQRELNELAAENRALMKAAKKEIIALPDIEDKVEIPLFTSADQVPEYGSSGKLKIVATRTRCQLSRTLLINLLTQSFIALYPDEAPETIRTFSGMLSDTIFNAMPVTTGCDVHRVYNADLLNPRPKRKRPDPVAKVNPPVSVDELQNNEFCKRFRVAMQS